MAKVEIIGPKNRFFDVVAVLHEQGRLHIEDLSKKIRTGEMPIDQMSVVPGQQAEHDKMEEFLLRMRSIIKALHLPEVKVDEAAREREYDRLWKLDSSELVREANDIIDEADETTSVLASAESSMQSEAALMSRYEPILHKIQPLARQIVTTGAFESVALLMERRYKSALEGLKEELNKITHSQSEIATIDVDDDTTAAILVFNRAFSEPVHRFLEMENVNQIRLPSDFDDMPFDQAYDLMRERRRALPKEIEKVRGELEKLSDKWYLKLTTIRDVLSDRIAEISAIPNFGQTEYAFVVTGWIPVSDLPGLRKTLETDFGQDVIIEQRDISEEEYADTPVALKNPKVVQPFQSLLAMYGMPKYGTIDPTLLLFLFYPLFFGMIVGDVGYGLVMLLVVLWLRFRYHDKPGVQIATYILGPASTMVILFGFLYAEFFGNVWTRYLNVVRPISVFGVHLPFHRVELTMGFMGLAIAVGFAQVALGLVFGVINGFRTRHMSHVYEKGGMLAFLLGFPMVFAGLAAIREALGPAALWVQGAGGLLMLFGFIFAIKGGKVMGAIESVLQLSNVASYIRIMAVGLAGAIFADAVNDIVAKTGNVVTGAIIAVLLHSLNFVIAAFSPTIHALRLNFLEFFGKFYETGKQQYSPFHKTGGEKST